ncbi:hypothetical protein QR680_000978 [Steinernema hermaphroditum]|uniref:Methyltransferase domain-containing protein n=1 Tax=Steinernema hermaphroditum TaxID=289476 RepID=A0AA39GWJ4_9BILA|nr:hypothetical protein QR680_000978 [Steinernema hermaphroditum]
MEAAIKRLENQREFYETMFDDFVKGRSQYNSSFAFLTNILRSEVVCENLIRFGSKKDGGHWICSPHTMLRKKCSIYSIGVDNNLSFETAIHRFTRNKCKLYVYDMLNDDSSTKARIENELHGRFENVSVEEVGNPNAKTKGLSDLFIDNGHRTIDILKVDQKENVKELVGSVAGLYDIHHILATHYGKPEHVARYIATMSDLHYTLYSWEFDHRRPNTVTTSHIANKEHNESEFSAYHGQYYSIPMQLP